MAKHVTFAECTKADPSAFEFTYQTIPNSFLAANKDKLSRILPRYDTVFLVDDSTSMRLKDGQLQKARWTIAGIWLAVLAEIAAHYDRDGVDIYFFHSKVVGKGLRSKHDVLNLFKEVQHFTAGTPTKTSINAILHEYFRRYPRVKPLNLIIITDGAPNPFTEDPTSAIEDCMKKMDELGIPQNVRQVGFMFAQVGNDYGAEQSLRQLDDKYRNSRRDIVDTFKSNMSNMRWTEHDWNFDVIPLLLHRITRPRRQVRRISSHSICINSTDIRSSIPTQLMNTLINRRRMHINSRLQLRFTKISKTLRLLPLCILIKQTKADQALTLHTTTPAQASTEGGSDSFRVSEALLARCTFYFDIPPFHGSEHSQPLQIIAIRIRCTVQYYILCSGTVPLYE